MLDDVLAIDTKAWSGMQKVLELISAGREFTPAEASARAGLPAARSAMPAHHSRGGDGTIAVLPLFGFVSHRPSFLSLVFGGTSTVVLGAEVRRAAADASVTEILIPTDSPGGLVAGVEELATTIAAAARQKPVTAVADTLAASPAYWAISGATEIVASPSAQIGSIGVVAVHSDLSKALSGLGVKRTYIVSSRYKAEGTSDEPLSPEARDEMQRRVDEVDRMMTGRIAAGRRVSVERVRTGFGEGRIYGAGEAVSRGMADRIATFESTLARMISGKGSPQASATADQLRLRVAVAALERRPLSEEDRDHLRLQVAVAAAARR